jgi:hypothetical protein
MNDYTKNVQCRPFKIAGINCPATAELAGVGVVRVNGYCLDSVASPMQIKNNDYILVKQVDIDLESDVSCLRKMPLHKIAGVLIGGVMYCKEIMFADLSTRVLYLKQYNPGKVFGVPFNKIEAIFDVLQVVKGKVVNINNYDK